MPLDFQPYFNRFITDSLVLDQTREGRIRDALSHLSRLVATDPALRRYRPELMLQGSYAAAMAVRPARDRDEFDVDAILKLNAPPSWSATDALDFVHSRLADDSRRRRLLGVAGGEVRHARLAAPAASGICGSVRLHAYSDPTRERRFRPPARLATAEPSSHEDERARQAGDDHHDAVHDGRGDA
jgi:hypothetical protein